MLTCTNLSKQFKEKKAVDGLSFSVRLGEVFALLGSNGAGKTTTIKMILGLVPKDSGSIELKRSVNIGYSPETPYMAPFLTGAEALRYYAKLQKIPREKIPLEVKVALETAGLEDNKIKVKNYSKGMLQRLAVAQALLGNPDFLILDEPTAGLDALGRAQMVSLLQRLKAEGKTVLLNSHILNDVERVCDRAVIMDHGRALKEWCPSDDDERTLEEIFIDTIGGVKP